MCSRPGLRCFAFCAPSQARRPGAWRAFALSGSLALLTHYFAVFLLIPMCLWLLRRRERLRVTLPAVGTIGVVGLALLPLISAQGAHGTQWIGRWPLSERLQAIPQYYLTGESGEPLGHGLELLVALVALAGLLYGLWRVLEPREERAAALMATITACGVLIPIVLLALGWDYLAPRNLIAAMIPLTALLGVVIVTPRTGRVGVALAILLCHVRRTHNRREPLSPPAARGLARCRECVAWRTRQSARSRPSSSAPLRSSTTCRRCKPFIGEP